MVPTFITQGYFLEIVKPQDDGHRHAFCGPHLIPGAHCPNCDKPLLRFLSLDTCDPRLGLQHCPFPALPLVYCWTCNIAQEPFLYQVNADGGVQLLQYGDDGVEEFFLTKITLIIFQASNHNWCR